MATIQLRADLPSAVVKAQLVKTFSTHFFRTNTTEFFGIRQLPFNIKLGRVSLCFMDTTSDKGSINIAVKEIYNNNFIFTR